MKVLTRPANDNLSRDLRRYQVRLKVTATGVLIFAFWGFIRNILVTILNADDRAEYRNSLKEIMSKLSAEQTTAVVIGVSLVVIGLFLFDCIFRINIYMLARRESSDPNAKRTNSYIIMTGVLILGSLWSIYGIASQTAKGEYAVDDCIISSLIELTSLVTMGELIDAALKLRKLRDEAAARSHAASTDLTDQNPAGPAPASADTAPADLPVKEARHE